MEFYSPPLKKARPESGLSNGGSDKPSFDHTSLNLNSAEREPFPTVGSKSKACLKYFSTSGCPYGEGCHFSHYVPGGVAALGSLSGFKTRLCKRFESPEGCPFGPNCHFAHGAQELRLNGFADTKSFDRFALNYAEPTPPGLTVAGATPFGAISTAKVSISASLAGIIVGKGGSNAKAISRATGAKLFIRDHESDATLKNVEMEGSLDQIKLASGMVRELLANKDIAPTKPGGLGSQSYKSKLCANFAKGSCTYGDRCHFAHGEGELRQATSL
ncbi:hypothetical protein GOP47_0019926 [Adiantum capillus-veneris]|uniref:C3H1-type domain-containing protein n=1 Tax=Adiantum capillus-veneris TaxID=13818 RepID=A0A9D4ZA41_ADICA|nr:hypothetical protein GOP47_0019926 [Adiantum capillus-veneris]